MRQDTCRREDRRPGLFPPPVGAPAQLGPSPEQQPHDLGRGVGQTGAQSPLGCLRASQRERENPSQRPRGLHASEPSCSHAKAMGRQPEGHQASSTPSRQDTSRPNRAWNGHPCFPADGQQEGTQVDEPRSLPLDPKSHTQSDNTRYCPGLKQKPNHDPEFKKKPLENDTCPAGRWSRPQALPGGQPTSANCPTAFSQDAHLLLEGWAWALGDSSVRMKTRGQHFLLGIPRLICWG